MHFTYYTGSSDPLCFINLCNGAHCSASSYFIIMMTSMCLTKPFFMAFYIFITLIQTLASKEFSIKQCQRQTLYKSPLVISNQIKLVDVNWQGESCDLVKLTLSRSICISEIARLTSERTVSYISPTPGWFLCTHCRSQDPLKIIYIHQKHWLIFDLKIFTLRNNLSWIKVSWI